MDETLYVWQPLRPDEVLELLNDAPIPWWIAGGWAIDLFRGQVTRELEDIDVLILRRDQFVLQEFLGDWDLHKTQQPGLKPWPKGEFLQPGVNDVWCKREPCRPWVMEIMLMDTDGDEWVYRREPRVRGAVASLGAKTPDEIPYLRPEIQLLYKAKPETWEKDRHDFDCVVPLLNEEARQWLRNALSLQFEHGHEWIDQLREFDDKSRMATRSESGDTR